jgi:hypothetical protein
MVKYYTLYTGSFEKMSSASSAARLFLLLLSLSSSCSSSPPPCAVDPPGQCAWYDGALPLAARLSALLAALTTAEKLSVLSQKSVPRLHINHDGFNEALHGGEYF